MDSLVLGVVGSAIGGSLLGGFSLLGATTTGAQIGGAIGTSIGALIFIHARRNKRVSEEMFSAHWRWKIAYAFLLKMRNIRRMVSKAGPCNLDPVASVAGS